MTDLIRVLIDLLQSGEVRFDPESACASAKTIARHSGTTTCHSGDQIELL